MIGNGVFVRDDFDFINLHAHEIAPIYIVIIIKAEN